MNRTLTVLLAVLVATSALTGVVVAQSSEDTSFVDKLVEPGDQGTDGILADAALAAARLSSTPDRVIADWFGDEGNATQYAQNFKQTFNANNQTITKYTNERINASTSLDVLAVTFSDKSGHESTVFLVANASTNQYQNVRVVNDTTRTVDENLTADWYLSRNAASELDAFVTDYADPGEDLSNSYKVSMVAQYGGSVSGSIWENNSTTTERVVPLSEVAA
jgi:hypothetical protein